MAIPTFVAAGAGAASTTTITPALPAGILTNDILLLFLENQDAAAPTITAQNGGTWAAVTGSPVFADGTDDARITVFWSRYNGTQGAPTTNDPGNHIYGVIVAWRGVIATGDPWDVTSTGFILDDTNQTITIPGATTSVGDCLVVACIADGRDVAGVRWSAWANGDLSGVTERFDGGTGLGLGGGLGVAEGGKAAAGAYGNTTATFFTATAVSKAYMTIALKPTAGFFIAVGQVLETNLAQAIAWAPKHRLIGQVLETNVAQAIGRVKTRGIGQVVETNLAQAVTVSPLRRLITQVVETNLAQTITASVAGAVTATRAWFALVLRR